uniref:Protein-serine O-palmitoleoyltransferase porcupine n=1 Tax=Heterorhabditis bacteriophora TaxID=37862 RepID=A0A1I7XGG4_HETBA
MDIYKPYERMDNDFTEDIQQLYLNDINITEDDLYRIYIGEYEQQEINDAEQVGQCLRGVLDSIHANIFLLLAVTLVQRLIAVTCRWLISSYLYVLIFVLVYVYFKEIKQCHPRWEELLPSLAYLFNPSTIIFGPFTTYSEYISSYEYRSLKEELLSVIRCCVCLGVSLSCLLYSSCAYILFPTRGLMSDFSTAQSFRMSHYFICFLAQGLSILSGLSTFISDPIAIELPRSLVEVVVVWNMPMHRYLHRYTYLKSIKLGPSIAIFITFLVSSLLHVSLARLLCVNISLKPIQHIFKGLNFQLSAVLLSLGLYCYFENKLRNSLSSRLSACIRSRACRKCNHIRKQYSSLSLLFNLLFFALSIYHLTYLGMPFNGEGAEEGYHWQHTIKIWGQHYYFSHIIATLIAILSYVI